MKQIYTFQMQPYLNIEYLLLNIAYLRRRLLAVSKLCSGFMLLVIIAHSSMEGAEKRWFRAFSWGGTMRDVYYSSKEGEEKKLTLYHDMLSPVQKVEGSMKTMLYRKEMVDGEEKKIPIANITFLENTWSHLVIVFAGAKQKGLHRTIVYPNATKGFPKGSMRMYNFTNKQIAIRLGKTMNMIKPLGNKVLQFPKGKDIAKVELSKLYENNPSAPQTEGSEALAIGINDGDDWVPAFRSAWPRRSGSRTHFFIFPIGEKRYRVHSLYENE